MAQDSRSEGDGWTEVPTSASTRGESTAVAATVGSAGTLWALFTTGWFALVGIVFYPVMAGLHAYVHHRAFAAPVSRQLRRRAAVSNALLAAAYGLQLAVGDSCSRLVALGSASPCLGSRWWDGWNILVFLPVWVSWALLDPADAPSRSDREGGL